MKARRNRVEVRGIAQRWNEGEFRRVRNFERGEGAVEKRKLKNRRKTGQKSVARSIRSDVVGLFDTQVTYVSR